MIMVHLGVPAVLLVHLGGPGNGIKTHLLSLHSSLCFTLVLAHVYVLYWSVFTSN